MGFPLRNNGDSVKRSLCYDHMVSDLDVDTMVESSMYRLWPLSF